MTNISEIQPIIETGFYDSDDKLVIEPPNDAKPNDDIDTKYTYENIVEFNKATCKAPSIDNPFMNTDLNEIILEDPPEACNADDDEIKNQIATTFNSDLYRSVGELYDVKNSQRQFYTLPATNPPDTIGLANWLYKGASSCKASQSACYNYEDLTRRNNLL